MIKSFTYYDQSYGRISKLWVIFALCDNVLATEQYFSTPKLTARLDFFGIQISIKSEMSVYFHEQRRHGIFLPLTRDCNFDISQEVVFVFLKYL